MEDRRAQYLIRRMRPDEIEFAIDLAAQEGWNPGLHDGDCFFRTDPGGFFVGLLDDRPIGCISAVSYAEDFGFIGLYIVLPPYRGQGYGLRLWEAAMEYLKGRNVGLDGVLAQQHNYRRSGFRSAYRNVRYEGSLDLPQSAPGLPEALIDATRVPIDTLCAYDRHCFPGERKEFLSQWIRMPGIRALAWVEGGSMAGYGVLRPCRRGYKIGPLFADGPELARGIVKGLCAQVRNGEPVALDVPEMNTQAVELAERWGMRKAFETARMYTGEPPRVAMERVFGVTTFELG